MAGVANPLRGLKTVSTAIFYTIPTNYAILANPKPGSV
jgi:hypothetical protein